MSHEATPNVHYKTSQLTKEEWEKKLSSGGTVFVALDDKKLAGTITVTLQNINKWYAKGTVARCRYVAVSPQYMRRHIASRMIDACAAWTEEQGIQYLFWTTAFNNDAAVKMCQANKFKKVDYVWYKDEDHPTIALMRWPEGKEPNDLKRLLYYCRRKMTVKKRK